MPGFLVTLLIGFTRSAVLILLLLGSFSASAAADENRWGFGTDVGVWTGTTNDSVFALGLHLDYYMDRNFSFGGMALFTPVGDLTEIGIAGVAKYHLRFSNGVNLVPFAGLGLVMPIWIAAPVRAGSIATIPVILSRWDSRWNIR
jgi:hypothetical protein